MAIVPQKQKQVNIPINRIYHPFYLDMLERWKMFRLVGEAGEEFLEEYLIKRKDESVEDFEARKKITYIPAFAKTALNQVQGSIRQRLTEVSRLGGSAAYQNAVKGLPTSLGVDRNRSNMNNFIGGKVLEELIKMGGVGIYIDAPAKTGNETLLDDFSANRTPFLYTFPVESIRSWAYDKSNPTIFTRLLLSEWVEVKDQVYDLTIGLKERFRYYFINDNGKMALRLFNDKGVRIGMDGNPDPNAEFESGLSRIPFVYAQLSSSLLSDIARYQIALLNLGSADMKYAYEGGVVFLAEQYDPNSPDMYFNHTMVESDEGDDALNSVGVDPKNPSKKFLGINRGMRVPAGINFPQYISPDMRPLEVSMVKQDKLKDQIQELVNQMLRTVTSRSSSKDTHAVNERREEDGLKAIGDELEHSENLIAEYWALYEGGAKGAEINYPISYQFKTDEDRRAEAKELGQLIYSVPSKKGQKAVSKKIITSILGGDVSDGELSEIYKEIDEAPSAVSDPIIMQKLVVEGIVSPETAAIQAGFSGNEAKKAEEARIRRATEIANAQVSAKMNAGARGINDLSVNPTEDARNEKNNAKAAGNKVVKDARVSATNEPNE